LCLEEFVSTELEGALKEVSSECRTDTSPDGTETLLSDNLPKAADKAFVVFDRVKLYPRLDAACG
jgi:hypothetical protein